MKFIDHYKYPKVGTIINQGYLQTKVKLVATTLQFKPSLFLFLRNTDTCKKEQAFDYALPAAILFYPLLPPAYTLVQLLVFEDIDKEIYENDPFCQDYIHMAIFQANHLPCPE